MQVLRPPYLHEGLVEQGDQLLEGRLGPSHRCGADEVRRQLLAVRTQRARLRRPGGDVHHLLVHGDGLLELGVVEELLEEEDLLRAVAGAGVVGRVEATADVVQRGQQVFHA